MRVIDERFHKYGRLTVLKRAKNTKSGMATWLCKCSCGNFIITTGARLRRGETRSCGCLQSEITKKRNHLSKASDFTILLKQFKKQAKIRNIKWSLSDEQVRNLVNQPCFYCGIEPKIYKKSNPKAYKVTTSYIGIDRLNNNEGYTPENVVPCCSVCNYLKWTLSLDEFKKQITKIYKHLNLQDKFKEIK